MYVVLLLLLRDFDRKLHLITSNALLLEAFIENRNRWITVDILITGIGTSPLHTIGKICFDRIEFFFGWSKYHILYFPYQPYLKIMPQSFTHPQSCYFNILFLRMNMALLFVYVFYSIFSAPGKFIYNTHSWLYLQYRTLY